MTNLGQAWQAALSAEHQAVFGYALLGPKLTGSDRQLAVSCSDAHEQLRNDVETAMAAVGGTPVPADADYPALYPVPDARAARLLAARLEDDCASAWRYLYGQAATTSGARAIALRATGQDALIASAVRATRWRLVLDPTRATTAFPGI